MHQRSKEWKCPTCGIINCILKPMTEDSEESKKTSEEARELASQINFQVHSRSGQFQHFVILRFIWKDGWIGFHGQLLCCNSSLESVNRFQYYAFYIEDRGSIFCTSDIKHSWTSDSKTLFGINYENYSSDRFFCQSFFPLSYVHCIHVNGPKATNWYSQKDWSKV